MRELPADVDGYAQLRQLLDLEAATFDNSFAERVNAFWAHLQQTRKPGSCGLAEPGRDHHHNTIEGARRARVVS
jgi:hypothetical protein